MFELVRALREGNFNSYVESVTAMTPWRFVLDHVNYARWLSVHERDTVQLKDFHPKVYEHFESGAFVVNKTTRVFSAIALDHAHEQENAAIKGDDGAVWADRKPK